MSNNLFPSFSFPFTTSLDRRQFFVDYGRTGPAYIFKDIEEKIRCISQKKENDRPEKIRFVSKKPTLPLNLPDTSQELIDTDYKFAPDHVAHDLIREQVSYLSSDYGVIVYGEIAEQIGSDLSNLSWKHSNSLSNDIKRRKRRLSLDPLLGILQDDFSVIPTETLREFLLEVYELEKLKISGKTYGNCLACKKTSDFGLPFLAAYPGGKTMNNLCFSALEIHSDENSSFSARLSEETTSFSLPERIHQIAMGENFEERFITAVRSDYKCWFFMTGSSNIFEKPTYLGDLDCKTTPCTMAINPYIGEEVVIAMETGSLWLWNGNICSVETVRQCSACTREEFDWYLCQFGQHPRQVVRGNQVNMEFIDFRVGPSISTDLLSLPSPHFLHDDKFTALERHPHNPYHYFIATTKTLTIMDERFLQHPVLKWCHSLECPPKHISVVTDAVPESKDEIILVGSYDNPSIHCFQYCCDENTTFSLGTTDAFPGVLPPRSASNPWKICPYDEWPEIVDFPKKGEWLSTITKRLSQPLLGLSCVRPFNNPQESLTVLQLSGAGDLFYQSLSPKKFALDEVRENDHAQFYEKLNLDLISCGGCRSEEPALTEHENKFVTQWMDCVIQDAVDKNRNTIEKSLKNRDLVDVSLTREQLLASIELKTTCPLCGNGKSVVAPSFDSVDSSDVCSFCGMNKETSELIKRGTTSESTVLTKEYLGLMYESEPLELFDKDMKCEQPLGKVLLQNWESDEQLPIDLSSWYENAKPSENDEPAITKGSEVDQMRQSPTDEDLEDNPD